LKRVILPAWFLIACATPVFADTDAFAAQMRACSALPHPGERLSCYDHTASSTTPASETDIATAREAHFGLLLGAQPPPPQSRGPELESIFAKVVRSSRGADEILLVTLDNGQVWSIHSRDPLLRPGDSVAIRRAVAGSFTMNVPSRRPVKVRRVS
jgi:hypothetical protein